MHFDVDPFTIFLTLSGSHAYGMARPDSDVDVRGICIPPREVRDSLTKSFDQFTAGFQEGSWGPRSVQALNRVAMHPTAGFSYQNLQNLDLVIYDLGKFLKLAGNANPNILELLFVDDADVLYSNFLWTYLRDNRHLFLSRKCKHTFTGYAHSQLRRIKGHREWLLNPPKGEPLRKDFGLMEESMLPADVRNLVDEAVKKVLRDWEMEDDIELSGASQDVFRERVRDFYGAKLKQDANMGDQMYELAALSVGVSKDVLGVIKAERAYRNARRHWQQFLRWKKERNPKRAEMEAKHGFDSKHGSHLIRLMRMGLEILRGEGVIVRRPDAEDLLAIRQGKWSYENLIEEAENLENLIKEAVKTTDLPKSPDWDQIDVIYRAMLDKNV